MRVCWAVDEHGSRDRWVVVDDADLATCETEVERDALIDTYIQEAFEQQVMWYRIPEKDKP